MAGVNLFGLGDSLLYGVGATTPDKSWRNQLAGIRGVNIDVAANPGAYLQDFFGGNSVYRFVFNPSSDQQVNQAVPATFDLDYYAWGFIEAIINDARLDGYDLTDPNPLNTPATFRIAYEAILNELNRRGMPNSKMFIINCGIEINASDKEVARIASFNQSCADIVASRTGMHLIDLHSFLQSLPEPKEDMYVDGLHYNDALHLMVAQFISDTIDTWTDNPTDPTNELFIPYGNYIIS